MKVFIFSFLVLLLAVVPATGATVSGVVTVAANAEDNVGVVGVQFLLDGVSFGAEVTVFPYTLAWNTRTASDGIHSLTAVARDAAGNRHATAMTLTVDNIPPTVSLTAPSNGSTVTGVAVTVSANAFDNLGLVGVQFQIDGVNITAEDTSTPYSITWDSTTLVNGLHSLTAVARDVAGNISTHTIAVTLSNAVPGNFSKVSPANTATEQPRGSTLSWAAAGNSSSYDYCVDTINNNSCDSGWTNITGNSVFLGGLNTATTYWWQVRARNGAGSNEANGGTWWSFRTGSFINVAAAANGGTASASSAYDSNYGPNGVINGDRKGLSWGNGGGWNDYTPAIYPDWIQVDFSSPKLINEIDVYTLQDAYSNPIEPTLSTSFTLYGVTAFQAQYWDGASWIVVPGGNITGNNKVWRQISFSTITTQRIRIFITGVLNGYSRITEVEAYSNLNVVPGSFTKAGPANTATRQTLAPTLSWGASGSATSYEYCVDVINNNSCDSSWTSTTNTTAVAGGPGGLSAGTTYWWQVRARNNAGTIDADLGTWWSFTTTATGTINVAAASTGATANASSYFDARYSPNGAINGDRKGLSWGSNGGWNDATASSFPDWLEVDFAGPQTIDEIDVFSLQDVYLSPLEPVLGMPFSLYGITAFQVQYWDGFSWISIPGGNITNNNQVWRQIVFSAITTQKIRIYIADALSSYSRITEVEAYSSQNVVPVLPVAPGPFTKVSPANNATGQAVNATLNWGTSSGAASYEYCVDTINNNSCDTGWVSTANTNVVLAGLSTGTAYWWQVRARNAGGTTDADIGAWSGFTTLFGGRVNVAAATSGATVSASSFYNTQYPPSAAINGDRKGVAWGGGGGWNDGTESTFPDWLQVDFVGPQTINEIDVFTLQDVFANPVEPTLGMPFSQYGITAFQVQYWDGLNWVAVPGGNINGNNQVWRQIAFSAVTTSKIRIQVTAALASFSRITEVEAYADLSVLPGAFAKTSPANAATGQPVIPTLTWGTSSSANNYEYCIDTINNNSCDTSWTSTPGTSVVLGGLNPNTSYWWQVRSSNGTGTAAANSATWWSFTTGSLVNVAAASNGAAVSASSFYNAQYAPAGAIDGDRNGQSWGNGGGWNDGTADTFPDWLQINFAGAKTIAEIDVFTVQDNYALPSAPTPAMTFSQYGITNFRVQYWDGSNWVDVPNGNISGNNLVWQKIKFTPLTTTQIRIYVTGALNSWSRITEVEAY